MVLVQWLVHLLVVEEPGLVRKAQVKESRVQVLLETEGREFHPGHLVGSAPGRTKHLRGEV